MKTICIDIDGTISHYIEWVDSKTFGEVLPHCAETIHHLKADGWFVIIYTTRADKDEIKKFLDANNVPFDAINENPNQPSNAKGGKPIADVYIDDRAIQFDGDWEGAYSKITGFKSWEEKPEMKQRPSKEYSADLMIADFSQCMETHRHYDSLNWQITKFAFGEILVAIGACWTVYSFDMAKDTEPELKWLAIGLIGLVSWLFGILSIYTIVKNRGYFVRTSRHINELRHHAIASKPMGFENSAHFWEDPTYPKVRDWKSTQFFSLYMLVLLLMAISYLTTYSFVQLFEGSCYWIGWLSVLATIGIWLAIVFTAVKEKF